MSYQNSSIPLPCLEADLSCCAGERSQVCIWERRTETRGSRAAHYCSPFCLLEQTQGSTHKTGALWGDSNVQQSSSCAQIKVV